MNNTESLTQEQSDVLALFSEITSYDADDEEESNKVLRLLTVCNWNLETAIARYFDNDFPQLFDDPSVADRPSSETLTSFQGEAFVPEIQRLLPETPSNFTTAFPNPLILPKLQRALPINNKWKFEAGLLSSQKAKLRYNSFLTPIVFILMLIPNILLIVGYGLNKVFGNFAPHLFRILGLREDEDDFPGHPLHITNDENRVDSVKSFMNDIETNEKEESSLLWSGEFNAAFNEAKTNHRWLCVALLNSQASSSSQQMKKFLTSQAFKSFIQKHDVILYVGDVSYSEAFEVGETYHVYGLPFIGLIGSVSVDGLQPPELSVVCKYLHILRHDPKRVIKRLNLAVERFEPQLVTQRFDKEERDLSKLIREEQDNAYQESLLRDMEREHEKQIKAEEKERILMEEERIAEEKRVNEVKHKERIIRKINESYIRNDESWMKGEYTSIQFRKEDGQRFVRKFHSTDSANDIYDYVLSKELIDSMINEGDKDLTELEVLSQLRDYQYEYDETNNSIAYGFELVSPMPRLRLTPSAKLISDIKEIWPNGSLLVERIYEEEEDTDEDV